MHACMAGKHQNSDFRAVKGLSRGRVGQGWTEISFCLHLSSTYLKNYPWTMVWLVLYSTNPSMRVIALNWSRDYSADHIFVQFVVWWVMEIGEMEKAYFDVFVAFSKKDRYIIFLSCTVFENDWKMTYYFTVESRFSKVILLVNIQQFYSITKSSKIYRIDILVWKIHVRLFTIFKPVPYYICINQRSTHILHPNDNVAQMVQIGQLHMIGKAYLRILCPYVSNLMEPK